MSRMQITLYPQHQEAVKRRAKSQGCTFSFVVNELLSAVLGSEKEEDKAKKPKR